MYAVRRITVSFVHTKARPDESLSPEALQHALRTAAVVPRDTLCVQFAGGPPDDVCPHLRALLAALYAHTDVPLPPRWRVECTADAADGACHLLALIPGLCDLTLTVCGARPGGRRRFGLKPFLSQEALAGLMRSPQLERLQIVVAVTHTVYAPVHARPLLSTSSSLHALSVTLPPLLYLGPGHHRWWMLPALLSGAPWLFV